MFFNTPQTQTPLQYSRYPNPYTQSTPAVSRTPMQELEEIRQTGELDRTDVTPITNGVNTDKFQEVELTAQTNQGQTYQTRTLVDIQSNEMYDPQDLPMEVMQELIETGKLVGVSYQQQMSSYCKYDNGQPECERHQEIIISGLGPNGEMYRSRM